MVLVIFVSNFTAATAATTHEICTLKQGWRQGRARGVHSPRRNMLAPCRKVKNFFSEIFGSGSTPQSSILAPSSEDSAPRRKFPGATPALKIFHCLQSGLYRGVIGLG